MNFSLIVNKDNILYLKICFGINLKKFGLLGNRCLKFKKKDFFETHFCCKITTSFLLNWKIKHIDWFYSKKFKFHEQNSNQFNFFRCIFHFFGLLQTILIPIKFSIFQKPKNRFFLMFFGFPTYVRVFSLYRAWNVQLYFFSHACVMVFISF